MKYLIWRMVYKELTKVFFANIGEIVLWWNWKSNENELKDTHCLDPSNLTRIFLVINFQNKDVGDQLPACYEQMLRDARGKITLISFDKLPHPIWASTTWQVLQTESSTKYTFCNRCQFTVLSLSEAGTNVMVCVTSFQITTDALTLSITIICDLCTFGKVLSVTLSSLH